MQLHLPNYVDTQCRAMTVCSQIDTSEQLPDVLRKRATMVASYRTCKGTAYVRLLVGAPQRHFHMDCALREFFGKGRTPKATHHKEQIAEVIRSCFGLSVHTNLIGTFFLPVDNLPQAGFIRRLMNENKMGEIGIKMTGATIAIQGTPIESVSWSLQDDKGTVRVRIEGRKDLKVDKEYLTEAFKLINTCFSLFVLGRAHDPQE